MKTVGSFSFNPNAFYGTNVRVAAWGTVRGGLSLPTATTPSPTSVFFWTGDGHICQFEFLSFLNVPPKFFPSNVWGHVQI